MADQNNSIKKYPQLSIETGCNRETLCPTPAAHSKLIEAHRLWHQALSEYGDPSGFRTFLNACIQALRSVTFVLQKQKHNFPSFEQWYETWQEKLKNDPILNWLVQARNIIVKEGDLELHSIARVSVLFDYSKSPHKEFYVNPLKPTKVIAREINFEEFPEKIKKDGIIGVERRWIAKDLPNNELLDALAHCYGVLSQLIDDAHAQLGLSGIKIHIKNRDGSHKPIGIPVDHLDGRLPCMIANDWVRTQWMKISTGEFLYLQSFEAEEVPFEFIKERYNLPDRSFFAEKSPKDLFALSELLFAQAKVILKADGYHSLIVCLILPNNSVSFMQLWPGDRSEKWLLWRSVASEVERTGAKSIIAIGEMWGSLIRPSVSETPPSESPDRFETLTLVAASSFGEEFSIVWKFHRRNNSIEFEEEEISTKAGHPFLLPIKSAWFRNKSRLIRKAYKKYTIERNSPCPCRSGKKFKRCCLDPLNQNYHEKAQTFFDEKKYPEAEIAFRSWLTQYIIWYHEHTLPLMQIDRGEANEIVEIDIKAIASICFSIADCMYHQNNSEEISEFLEKCEDIIEDKRFAIEISNIRDIFTVKRGILSDEWT